MINSYGDAVVGTFQILGPAIVSFGVRLIIAFAIFLIGYIVGSFIYKLVVHVFKKINVDSALSRAGVGDALRRGGVTLNSGAFVGSLIKWFVVLVFLIASFQIIGLSQVTFFLQQVVLAYLPQVIIAVLILVVAVVIGDVMQKIVRGSAGAAGIKSAALLGSLTKWIIWVFAILTVLVQLGIGADLIRILFTGIVVAGALAFGLAFGLGGQEHASRLISKVRDEISEKKY